MNQTLTILSPVPDRPAAGGLAGAAPDLPDRVRLGLLSNGKPNTEPLFDGILDVLTLGQTAVSLLLGSADGSLGDRTDLETTNPHGPATFFAIADLNADSKLDVVVVGSGIVSVFLGNGDGTFGARMDDTRWGDALSMAVGDLNGDSKQDIAFSQGGGIKAL